MYSILCNRWNTHFVNSCTIPLACTMLYNSGRAARVLSHGPLAADQEGEAPLLARCVHRHHQRECEERQLCRARTHPAAVHGGKACKIYRMYACASGSGTNYSLLSYLISPFSYIYLIACMYYML